MLYFAYGSNMSETKMKTLQINYSLREKASLENYHLVFNKQAKKDPNTGFANIEQEPGHIVEGILYDIPSDEVIYLDRCEGFPRHYVKKEVEVKLSTGEKVNAMTYVANREKVRPNLKPSKEYMQIILEGSEYLSKNYVKTLKKVSVL